MRAERALGRVPEQQHHSNPGYDVLSTDPHTGRCYFIEVKGHRPGTEQISVSTRQVGKAKCDPERWRLAVVSVPDGTDNAADTDSIADPDTSDSNTENPADTPDSSAQPEVTYLVEPFKNVRMHPAQTSVPLKVSDLVADPGAGPPR